MGYLNFVMKEKDGAGKRKCKPMERIALFLIVPYTSLLFPTALIGVHTPLPLPEETGEKPETTNNKTR